MGFANAFSFSTNFNGMLACNNNCYSSSSSLTPIAPLTVNELVHKANINFDESGTIVNENPNNEILLNGMHSIIK